MTWSLATPAQAMWEVQSLLRPEWLVRSPTIWSEPVAETGATFRANALFRAPRRASRGLPALATIPDWKWSTGGEPLLVARYAGPQADEGPTSQVLAALRGVPDASEPPGFRVLVWSLVPTPICLIAGGLGRANMQRPSLGGLATTALRIRYGFAAAKWPETKKCTKPQGQDWPSCGPCSRATVLGAGLCTTGADGIYQSITALLILRHV